MIIKSTALYLFAGLFLFASANFSTTFAQEDSVGAPGSEQPLFKKMDAATGNACYVYKQYVVQTVTSADVGEDIKIYKRSGATNARQECGSAGQTPYMTLKNSGENYFFGLTGEKFLVDSGTSAGIRGLDIASLISKKVVFSTDYQDDVKVGGNFVVYSKPSKTKGLLKNCPNAAKWKKQGGGVGWVIPMRIDLTTLKETAAGKLACVYVE